MKREQARLARKRQADEIARARDDEKRKREIAALEAARAKAARPHEGRLARIEEARAALDRRLESEIARWRRENEVLERRLRARPVVTLGESTDGRRIANPGEAPNLPCAVQPDVAVSRRYMGRVSPRFLAWLDASKDLQNQRFSSLRISPTIPVLSVTWLHAGSSGLLQPVRDCRWLAKSP